MTPTSPIEISAYPRKKVSLRGYSYRLYLSVCFFLLVLFSLLLGHSSLGIFILALVDLCFCGDVLLITAWQDAFRGRLGVLGLAVLGIIGGLVYSAVNTFLPAWGRAPLPDLYLYEMALISVMLWLERRRVLEGERIHLFDKQIQGFLPKSARVRHGNDYKKVFAHEVKEGDELLVQAGERLAADGILYKGEGSIDEQLLTGNILPAIKGKNSRVYAATRCKTGPLYVRVTRPLEKSTFVEILQAVGRGEVRKNTSHVQLDKVAWRWLLAWLLLGACLYVGLTCFLLKGTVEWGKILFLAGVMCPLAFPFTLLFPSFLASFAAKRNQIEIHNLYVLPLLTQADVFFFDKTGTLTQGDLVISGLYPSKTSSEAALLEAAATAEQSVNGSFATAVLSHAKQKGISPRAAAYFEIFAGQGIRASQGKNTLWVGSVSWLAKQGFANLPPIPTQDQTIIGVAENKQFLGYITLADKIRPFVEKTLDFLRAQGKEIMLVSGDNERSVRAVAQAVHIEKYNFEVLPKTKAEIVNNLRLLGKKVVMVGDGFNDILALLQADVGLVFSSGKNGYNHWVDGVIKRRDLYALVYLFKLKKKFSRLCYQNMALCIAANAALIGWLMTLPAGSVKWYILISANAAMMGLMLLNSIRMLRVK